MIYKGSFKDANNKQYNLIINVSGVTGMTQELTLGTPPFTTKMDGEGSTLYKTAKYQTASITYVDNTEYYNLYAATAHGTKVTLTDSNNNTIWVGYLTPNSYNQDYQGYNHEITLEAIDGLSTLQYIKYTPIGDSKEVVSFHDIIKHCLKACDCYNDFYVAANTNLTPTSTTPFTQQIYISEYNFFDEKEDNETDNDVAWSMKDVLEEICQYLNMTMVAFGDSVYFLDYDYLISDKSQYHHFYINNDSRTTANLSSSVKITSDQIKKDGQTVSLGDVYNKVTIKADNYTCDSLIPDIFDNLTNITSDSDPSLNVSTRYEYGYGGEVIKAASGVSDSENMITFFDGVYRGSAVNFVAVKYYTNPKWKLYRYDKNSGNTTVNYGDTRTYQGAILSKFSVSELQNWNKQEMGFIMELWKSGWSGYTWDDVLADGEVTSITFSNYVELLNPDTNTKSGITHIDASDIANHPFIENIDNENIGIFGGDNAYLQLTGSYIYHYQDEDVYPIPKGEIDLSEGKYKILGTPMNYYFLVRLQVGNNYYDGSGWTTTESTFKVPYLKLVPSGSEKRADHNMFTENSFQNNVTWRMGITTSGFMIKLPSDGQLLTGAPKLTIYCPYDPDYYNESRDKGKWYRHKRVFLKDLKLKTIVTDPTFSGALDTDTEYTNVINEGYVNELKTITWKISTYDNKKQCFSAVAYMKNDNLYWLDKTFSYATQKGEQNWENSDYDAPKKGELKQEEHMIYRLVNQYSTPSVQLNYTLDLTSMKPWTVYTEKIQNNKKFIIDEFSIDYENATVDLSLIEKK